MHSEYWLEAIRLQHDKRRRAAEERRLAAAVQIPSPVRRWFGSALIRFGVLVGGPTVARSPGLVPAHRGGVAR